MIWSFCHAGRRTTWPLCHMTNVRFYGLIGNSTRIIVQVIRLRHIVGFGFVEMAISTNPSPRNILTCTRIRVQCGKNVQYSDDYSRHHGCIVGFFSHQRRVVVVCSWEIVCVLCDQNNQYYCIGQYKKICKSHEKAACRRVNISLRRFLSQSRSRNYAPGRPILIE